MTLSYDIILPLMLCSVVAYYTAKGIEVRSLYSEALKRKAAEAPSASPFGTGQVSELMKGKPPTLPRNAHFAEIAQMFLSTRVNNLYVTDPEDRFLGAVSLHDIKPYLGELELAELVIASDILREDFPHVAPNATLSEALGRFLNFEAERLPVVNVDGTLIGSLAKGDLLLALVEMRKKPAAA
jgi:CIC family chloride channel protein